MKHKLSIRKPTHKLVKSGHVYAYVRCGHSSPAIKLTSTGETERSHSFVMDCDLLMGRWHDAVFYLFGHGADHIPETAKMIAVASKETQL